MLDFPSADESPSVGQYAEVFFLNEFWMIVSIPGNAPVPGFTLFNTLVPRNHPAASRRFRLPPRHRDWSLTVHVDGDRRLGMLGQDRLFTTDPTQAVLVMDVFSHPGPRVWFIVQIKTLIEHVCSISADAYVPWDVWGRDTVVMGGSSRGDGSSHPLVHGTHVIAVQRSTGVDGYHHNLCTFDFSRRGWSTQPLSDEGDGVERKAAFENGRDIPLQGHEGVNEWEFDSLGDGRIVYVVSRFRCLKVVVR